jgi:ABC-type bacteriocin/lantibiotic exporter with double-glycine peptidase domain
MILAYHGKHLSLDEVRQAVAVDRDGASLWGIIDAAQRYGLRGRGVQVELEGLKYLGTGSILFWEFSHFVVLERVRGDSVDIVDPAVGRRRIPMKQFRRLFTGVAATFEPTAEFEPTARKGTPFWRYLKQILGHSGLMYRILATSVLIQVFALALPVLTGTLVDRVLPRGDTNLLQTLGLGLAFLVLFHLISSVLREYLFLHLRTQMDLQMTLGFVEHLVDLPYAFFQLRPAGDLMMRMNSNATVREIITTGALSTMLDGTLVSLYLVLLFAASAEMAALVLVLGFMSVSLFLVTRRKQRDLMSQSLETQARTSSYQVEMLTGMETLKAMGTERRAVDHWSNLFVDNLNIHLAQGRLNAIFNSLKGALGMAGPLVILGFGGYQVLDGSLSLGTMLAVNALAMGFLSPLNKLVGTAVQFQLLGSYLDRINDVMETEPEQQGVEVAQPRRLRGKIELERVCFSYGPTSPQVVTSVSLNIRPGQHVAIVGRSGSGKSTLAKLLLGLYPPTQGRILYDDTDLSQLDCRAVRAQLGIVTQDPQLFSGSIRENIALANPRTSLDRIEEAVKLAALDEDIQQMPMGLETVLADRGLSLSGGQRQRIALARALVNRPAILLLDEATSAVDTVTEHQIHTAIEKLRCTRVTIAHRLSTVRRADVILALRDGEILEQGSFEELVAQGGYFAELVAHQRDQDAGEGAETAGAAGRP